jgi:hypothetical protein
VLSLTLALTLLAAEAPRLLTGAPALGESITERAIAAVQVVQQKPEPPAYAAEERAVTSWRREAAYALDPVPLSALAALFQLDRPIVTRCVKLNNYWCIKRAGWNGEIGSDDEGHTGFASAEQGADAAATLLRRYYLEFGRKSALDIVRPLGAGRVPHRCGGNCVANRARRARHRQHLTRSLACDAPCASGSSHQGCFSRKRRSVSAASAGATAARRAPVRRAAAAIPNDPGAGHRRRYGRAQGRDALRHARATCADPSPADSSLYRSGHEGHGGQKGCSADGPCAGETRYGKACRSAEAATDNARTGETRCKDVRHGPEGTTHQNRRSRDSRGSSAEAGRPRSP